MSDSDRIIVDTRNAAYESYDRYGISAETMTWLPVRVDEATGIGCFMVKFEPGGTSEPHIHTGGEHFLMIEGELVDDDGTVFKAGDFVSFAPGTSHSSHSPKGCTVAVFLSGENVVIDEAGES